MISVRPILATRPASTSRTPGAGTTPRGAGRRSGMVVFVVMVVIVMISLAGLSFVLTMSTENKAAHLHGDELQLEQVAASGVELLKAVCEMAPTERARLGGLADNSERFRGVLVVDDGEGSHHARFSLVSPRIEEGQIVGSRFGAENESARLNLTALLDWEEQHAGAGHEALMNLPGMTEAIAAAILDWIDDDATPRASGAEADYYLGRGVPYGPRNATPTSLEELLLIRDVSRELLFGADADFNYQVDPREQSATGLASGTSEQQVPWASLLTVYSAERNATDEGRPRVHLNQNDLGALYQQLTEVFDESWARFIVAYRQFGPSDAAPGLDPTRPDRPQIGRPRPDRARMGERRGRFGMRGPGIRSGFGGVDPVPPPPGEPVRPIRPGRPRGLGGDPVPELDLSLPAEFELASVLDLVGSRVQFPGEEDDEGEPQPGPVLESPFADDRNAMREYLPKLLDAVTLSEEKVIRGRINVNEAPREVLLAVPGMESSVVNQILAARAAHTGDDGSRRHAAWLLSEGIVDLEGMKRLMPFLTGGGDVFRAQVVAFFDDSDLSARAEVVVDATVSPARQVYWKDMRLLGRGYSLEDLGARTPTDATPVAAPFDELGGSSQFD